MQCNLYVCRLHCIKEELGLDISEVDIKKYTLDSGYRRQFFDSKALQSMFHSAEAGDVNSIMFLVAAFKEAYFSLGLARYAVKWCEKADNAGEINAMPSMASFYRWGEGGVFVNAEKAIYFL